MAKAFSLASWNVEHFRGDSKRVSRVIDFLASKEGGNKPDVFALYEVEGKKVYNSLVEKMPGYTFHITEGQQVQEILVGVKGNLTGFFTQRTEFKSGRKALRPGALLSLKIDGKNYSILFLHLKSLTNPEGFGLRDDMLHAATRFRRKLEKATDSPKWSSNLLFCGDLNTMGLDYPYKQDIDPELEIKRLDGRARGAKMIRLAKTAPATFFNGSNSKYPPSDLDHVVASNHMKFRTFNGKAVSVRGWVDQKTDAQKDKWIERYSDHSLLYLEVQK